MAVQLKWSAQVNLSSSSLITEVKRGDALFKLFKVFFKITLLKYSKLEAYLAWTLATEHLTILSNMLFRDSAKFIYNIHMSQRRLLAEQDYILIESLRIKNCEVLN